MSAGSLRDQFVLALARGDGQPWQSIAEASRHTAEVMYGKQADAVLAELREWLASEEAREVVALAALGARASSGCTEDAWRALPSQSRDFWRDQAEPILAALIDQTKED